MSTSIGMESVWDLSLQTKSQSNLEVQSNLSQKKVREVVLNSASSFNMTTALLISVLLELSEKQCRFKEYIRFYQIKDLYSKGNCKLKKSRNQRIV